ncbi:uncharacterized protein BDW47DRAFT_105771 [Aspergillus candidus]|uniref:Uncharacterized protein n=1 Tax=Aspergillus candidus TaxID=41067 RepID=A0A2I2FBT0_ASPCN|nr:hypothetical protein BDW47DRAFT_105771 [Aspergillus candidus]PLB38067.1 hypothetical protein BDW47DRAFT_105771 [Aspergillus candidus]
MGRLLENLFSRRSGVTSTEFGSPLLRLDERSDGGMPHRLLGASSSREAVERSMACGLQNAPCEGDINFDRSARRLHPASSARHRGSPRTGLLSTESTRPPRSIRRLTGWVSLLRSRRSRDKAAWEAFAVPDRSAYHAPITHGDRADGQLVPCASFLSEDPSSRKPSDRTTVSDLTAMTVSHHPSRRTLTPIPTVDRDPIFEDAGPDSTRLDDPQVMTAPVVQANPGFLYADVPFDFFPEPVERDVDEITLPACHCGSSSTESSGLPRSVSNEIRWPGGLDRQAAAIAFNELAGQFQFVPLSVPPDGEDAELDRTDETVPRRRDRVLVRIRSMRSSLSLGSVSPPRTLRRRRTVVGVRSTASAMTSLCGKSLEDLARLGGHSFLFLPPGFAPAPLRLPVCFVATAKYLRRFGQPPSPCCFHA